VHLHILGICGTFMGGIAALAREAGHRVTGSDRNVYPPMSTQLASLGVDVIEGYGADQIDLRPDVFVVGNVMSRGNPLVEALLDSGARYESGPEWLARNVLHGRWVLAVAGTHGKTTTTSLLTWILEHAGQAPGFLVGGVPLDFEVSARLGRGKPFVVEADEYDTAFFDPRPRPRRGQCRGPQPRRSAGHGLLDRGRTLCVRACGKRRLARSSRFIGELCELRGLASGYLPG
jgi:UDP-N-acetylmuramate: L-alanyl-gamma-D-glutamyl-meso-diaminopimelate ligase